MSKQLKKSIAMVIATSLVALPVVAKPVMQKITAYLNPSIEYIVDGEEVLEEANTINYKGKNYVSVAELANVLGKEVKVEGNKVIISTPTDTPEINDSDKMVIGKALIKDINGNQVTVLPIGLKDKTENYIVVNIGDETIIRNQKDKKIYALEDLKEGMFIKAVNGPQMTASLPPQVSAKEVIILAYQGETDIKPVDPTEEDTDYDLDEAIIKEVNHSQKYLVVVEDGQTYKIPFTNKTKVEFDDDDNHKNPNVNSLKAGQEVSIEVENGVAVEIEVED